MTGKQEILKLKRAFSKNTDVYDSPVYKRL